ncbi:MAG: hypothetical protein ACYC49_12620 [Ignavibacteriaceae bacterium]
MQKVQSQIKTTPNYQMNTSLSFSGMAALNFLNDEFKNYIPVWTMESIQTPYIYTKNHRDSQTLTKQKTLKTIRFKGFYVHPAGLEPATC